MKRRKKRREGGRVGDGGRVEEGKNNVNILIYGRN